MLLTNLLPGLRDLRAPLASGYIWLLSLWLGVSPNVPDKAHATGVLKDLYGLRDLFSGVGLAVGISFLAYLVGSLSEGFGEWPLKILVRRSSRKREYGRSLHASSFSKLFVSQSLFLSGSALRSLELLVRERTGNALRQLERAGVDSKRVLSELGERNWSADELPALLVGGDPLDLVLRELNLTATRLIGDQPELFAQVDRLRAESEFRIAITPPLIALVIVLTLRLSPFWLLAAPALMSLYTSGMRRRIQGGDLVADTVLAGKVEAPTLEKLKLAVQERIDEEHTRRQSPKG